MDQQENKSKTQTFNPFKFILLIIFSLFLAVLVIVSTLSILAPIEKIKEINNKYKDESLDSNFKAAFNHPSFLALKKEEAFIKSRLLMSENDSINLSINIPDSTISIEIKGTNIYSVPIKKLEISGVFNHLDKDALISFSSTPFCILHEKSTILKEPLIIKKAPKDTAEANKTNIQSDTLGPVLVAYRFYTDKDLMINIQQTENIGFKNTFINKFDYNLQISSIQLKKIIKLKIPDYIPWIQIEINKNEAVAIFRAIPEHAFISIHF